MRRCVSFGSAVSHVPVINRSAAGSAKVLAAVVLLRDQAAVPGQQSLGRHNSPQFDQQLASEAFGLGGQPAALVINEAQTFPA